MTSCDVTCCMYDCMSYIVPTLLERGWLSWKQEGSTCGVRDSSKEGRVYVCVCVCMCVLCVDSRFCKDL